MLTTDICAIAFTRIFRVAQYCIRVTSCTPTTRTVRRLRHQISWLCLGLYKTHWLWLRHGRTLTKILLLPSFRHGFRKPLLSQMSQCWLCICLMVECLESANSATCREADLTECGLSRGRRIALDVEASDTIDNVIDAGHFELINFAAQPYYVAIITPVIHYCMGGLKIDENSAVLGSDSEAIRGLYAAGVVAGGVHTNNRLGGNSLVDSVLRAPHQLSPSGF